MPDSGINTVIQYANRRSIGIYEIPIIRILSFCVWCSFFVVIKYHFVYSKLTCNYFF